MFSFMRFAAFNKSYKMAVEKAAVKQFHLSAAQSIYAEVEIPMPHNIDPAETTRFSHERTRDISATAIVSHYTQRPNAAAAIDITTSAAEICNSNSKEDQGGPDPRVQSYDCFGAVSLNSSMQSNVPTPFGGLHRFSHLNMPGGQWSQECKFTAQNLHSSHYRALRENVRSEWLVYDQNTTLSNAGADTSKRSYSTQATRQEAAQKELVAEKSAPEVLSKKEQLKRAFKDYGTTLVVFHVTISLASLGCCYMLVSNGINMLPILETLGIASSALADNIATGSTFVVAYAIHKVFAPVRITATLTAAPFIVHYLRRKGFLKAKANATETFK